jgi:Rrf2 family protein
MRISTRGRYSIEALLYLALLPQDEYASTSAISRETGISDGYLEQLFISLKKNNIITGIRGAQGGYKLSRTANLISIGEILRIAEGSLEPVACLSEKDCPSGALCRSRHTWQELYEEIADCVDSISLADLVTAYKKMDVEGYVI